MIGSKGSNCIIVPNLHSKRFACTDPKRKPIPVSNSGVTKANPLIFSSDISAINGGTRALRTPYITPRQKREQYNKMILVPYARKVQNTNDAGRT